MLVSGARNAGAIGWWGAAASRASLCSGKIPKFFGPTDAGVPIELMLLIEPTAARTVVQGPSSKPELVPDDARERYRIDDFARLQETGRSGVGSSSGSDFFQEVSQPVAMAAPALAVATSRRQTG